MTNSRLIFMSVALSALICCFIGAIAAQGTSILLPGLGLIIAGPIAGGLIGAVFGSVLGLLIGAIIVVIRRRTLP